MARSARKKEARQRALEKEKQRRALEKSMNFGVHGKRVKPLKNRQNIRGNQNEQKVFTREVQEYPSLETSGPAYAPRAERQEYTGTYVRGIAVMHKSNLVPVTQEVDPKEYSTMRRN